jgi:hypothetical protein
MTDTGYLYEYFLENSQNLKQDEKEAEESDEEKE